MGRTGRVAIVLGTAALAVAMLLVFTSGCSSTGGSTGLLSGSNSVVGTWKLDMSQGANSDITIVTFRADGTGQYNYDRTTPGYPQMDWHSSYSLTWRVDDSYYQSSLLKKIVTVDEKSMAGPQFDYDAKRDVLTQSAKPFVRVS